MEYIGGQTHIICENHKLPLIPVPDRKTKFQYGAKEHIQYPDLVCTICICKKCATEKNQNILIKISVNNEIDGSEEDSSIGLLESDYSKSTDDSRFEINSIDPFIQMKYQIC